MLGSVTRCSFSVAQDEFAYEKLKVKVNFCFVLPEIGPIELKKQQHWFRMKIKEFRQL